MIERIYNNLPVFLQNLGVSGMGLYLEKRRTRNQDFNKIFQKTCERDNISWEELRKIQKGMLSKNIEFAYRNSPFYKDYLDENNFNFQGDIFDEIYKLPLLTKNEIVQKQNMIIPTNFKKNKLTKITSSGTTGTPLTLFKTKKAERTNWAIVWRFRKRHGIYLDNWCGYFSGRHIVPARQNRAPFWRTDYYGKKHLFSIFHINQKTVEDYYKKIKNSKITWLHGYPSALALLGNLLIEKKLKLHGQIKIVTTGSENLTTRQKRVIEKAFEAPVRELYGLVEEVACISECPYGNLHVEEDFSFVEFVHIEKNHFKIVGTNFFNSAFFLLRYDTGDIVQLDKAKDCNCGKAGRIVKSIDGRLEDYVTLPDGSKIGRLNKIFNNVPNLKEAQIRQKQKEKIDVLLVTNKKYDKKKGELILKDEARKRLGNEIQVNIKYVERIPRSSNGKLRLVISEID